MLCLLTSMMSADPVSAWGGAKPRYCLLLVILGQPPRLPTCIVCHIPQLIYMYGGEAAKGTQGSVSPGMRSAMLELVIGGSHSYPLGIWGSGASIALAQGLGEGTTPQSQGASRWHGCVVHQASCAAGTVI